MDELGIENSPLFVKLRSNNRTTLRRVKLFWEMIEATLLAVYAEKKPYDTAIYYAHTEARDRTAVVFQQILCCDKDRGDIMRQLNNVTLSDKSRVVFPVVCTIEEEIIALKRILCGNEKKKSTDSTRGIQFKGVVLAPYLSEDVWAEVEEHLRYGIPPPTNSPPPSHSASVAPTPFPVEDSKEKDRLLTTPLSPGHPDGSISSGTQTMTPTHAELVQKRVRRHISGDLCLSNCGFTSSLISGSNPATNSLEDVRSWCHNLLRKTECFMTQKDLSCHMCGVKGVNQILRRLLLKSVCVLTQDRTQSSQNHDYLMVTQDSIQTMCIKLLESGNRTDARAVSQIQEGMKTLVGQDLQSHRYFGKGGLILGLQPSARHSGLKNLGGGFKEVLMVLVALHGSGAETVILDSPGFSLHPPQQKTLALWMAKHCTASLMVITNSTEYVTEDALPSLYCFRRVVQYSLKSYTFAPTTGSKTRKNRNVEDISSGASSAFTSPEFGVHVYEKPSLDSRVLRILDRDAELELYCRKSSNGFLHLGDRSGYILASDLKPTEANFLASEEDSFQEESEIVTRVRPLRHSKIDDAEMLRILDPSLKRLVFASGVFFFEGQSDYRVIEALKHVANNVAWEIITMHGAGEIQKVVNIVDALGIPYGVVVDYDQVRRCFYLLNHNPLQIMPTVSHVKQIDSVDMKLWKSSSIYRFLSERCGRGTPAPVTNPPSPVPPSGTSSSGATAKAINQYGAEELLGMLTSFRRSHSDDQEFSNRLQQLTTELKSSLQQANLYKEQDREPSKDKFSRAIEKIENILEDGALHVAIRAAMIRKELRDLGIFTWNSDLEGMIFGYGDPVHCEQIVETMPRSMKDFCLDQISSLSGTSFVPDARGTTLSRPTVGREKKASATSVRPPAGFNDYDRVLYLIQSSPTQDLLSIDLPKAYHRAFGTKFRCQNDGVVFPYSMLVDKLKANPNIRVIPLDPDALPQSALSSRPASSVPPSIISADEDEDEEDYDESTFAPLSDIDMIPSDSDDNAESEMSARDTDGDDADDIADAYDFKGRKKNFSDIREAKTFNDAVIKGGVTNKKKKGKGKDKEAARAKERKARYDPKKAPISDGYRRPEPTRGRGDDSDDDRLSKLFKFQWIGPRSTETQEPPDHVFHNPDYWVFVGSILHGAKDRGGMWRRLPWSVLKDVIASTKSVKIPENNIGKYMTSDDLRKYGRQSGLIPMHIGLQDLVDWMEEMETKAILTAPTG